MAHINLNSIQNPLAGALSVPLSIPMTIPRIPDTDNFAVARDISQMVCAPTTQSQHLIVPQQILYNTTQQQQQQQQQQLQIQKQQGQQQQQLQLQKQQQQQLQLQKQQQDQTNHHYQPVHLAGQYNASQGCSYKDVLKNSPFKCDKCSAVFMLEMFYQIHREKHGTDGHAPTGIDDAKLHNLLGGTNLTLGLATGTKKKKKGKKNAACKVAVLPKPKRKRLKPQMGVRRLPLFCMRCQFYASKVEELVSHMFLHGQNKSELTCGNCDYISNNRGNFRRHIMTHGNVRPHKCPYCPFTASQKTHLTKHISYHIGERIFKCNICSYSCADKANHNRHKKLHLENDAPTLH